MVSSSGSSGGGVSRRATTGTFFAVERSPDISVNKRLVLRIQRLLDFEGGEIVTQIRYDQDIVAWAHEQALLLRSGQLSAIDAEHLAEEIEAVSASERRELRDQPFVSLNRPAPPSICNCYRNYTSASIVCVRRRERSAQYGSPDRAWKSAPSLRSPVT